MPSCILPDGFEGGDAAPPYQDWMLTAKEPELPIGKNGRLFPWFDCH
jgi:hypothetical protein